MWELNIILAFIDWFIKVDFLRQYEIVSSIFIECQYDIPFYFGIFIVLKIPKFSVSWKW